MDHRVEGETADQAEAEGASTNLPARLPEDVFGDILRRLAPRDLAASRCVRKAWRDVVDGRRLLRTELLPLWVGGIFINFLNCDNTEFFSRPSASRPTISGKLDYLPFASQESWSDIIDHCNGLLLVTGGYDYSTDYVVNPATRWCAPLPPQPPNMDPYQDIVYDKYLVHDPTVSLQYEVFLIPHLSYYEYVAKLDPVIEQSEWPPSPCILHVFSSKTGQWEERSFVREGESAGTIADMRVDGSAYEERHAVFWRGALYVHCQTNFVMRISLANSKYQVIKPPVGTDVRYYPLIYVGKSKNGVYCAKGNDGVLQVWILKESSNHIEWVLKHGIDLSGCFSKHNLGSCYDYRRQVCGPWTLQNINSHYAEHKKNDAVEQPVDDKIEWSSEVSSDENSPLDSDHEDKKAQPYHEYIDVLGFHPYKEIIFLSESITRGLAYNLNSSKVQVLGTLYPATYDGHLSNEELINSSFPYTPCWLGHAVDENISEGHLNS